MYKKVSLKEELPPVGEYVTVIDEKDNYRAYAMNKDGSWTLRDSDGINSPNNNLKLTHWIKKCDRDDYLEISRQISLINNIKEKKLQLQGLKDRVIEILKGHVEIPEKEVFLVFQNLDVLSKYLDAEILRINKSFDI